MKPPFVSWLIMNAQQFGVVAQDLADDVLTDPALGPDSSALAVRHSMQACGACPEALRELDRLELRYLGR